MAEVSDGVSLTPSTAAPGQERSKLPSSANRTTMKPRRQWTERKHQADFTTNKLSEEPETMHKPTKMASTRAESVGMSIEGLNNIDKLMQKHTKAGDIQGGVTLVARQGKVVHFSTCLLYTSPSPRDRG